jgi:5,10-methylenetetrahydromethanopterin reductase
MVEFGVEFVPQNPYWKTTYYAIQSERLGFDYVWVTDHFNNRNVYVSLTLIANYTNQIRLGPGLTNPYLVHPVVTAQAIGSLNEIAPGRVICGIGVGDKTTLNMLKTPQVKPLSAVREAVKIIRDMCAGKRTALKGEVFNVEGASFLFQIQDRIPIFIGAQGPRMLALASEIGDGVLINASHPKDVEKAVKVVAEAAARVNRAPGEPIVAAYTSFSISSDAKRAVKAVTPVVAYIVAGCPEPILNAHGIPIEAANKIRESITHAKWKDAFSQVTPEMIEAFSICGIPEECLSKVERLLKIGVTQFVVGSPIGPNIRESIDLIGREIIPRYKEGKI